MIDNAIELVVNCICDLKKCLVVNMADIFANMLRLVIR